MRSSAGCCCDLQVAGCHCAGLVAAGVNDGFGGEEDTCGGAVGGAVGAAGEVDGAGVLADDSCETQRPRPVPRSPLVVKKGWKRRSRIAGGFPGRCL